MFCLKSVARPYFKTQQKEQINLIRYWAKDMGMYRRQIITYRSWSAASLSCGECRSRVTGGSATYLWGWLQSAGTAADASEKLGQLLAAVKGDRPTVDISQKTKHTAALITQK